MGEFPSYMDKPYDQTLDPTQKARREEYLKNEAGRAMAANKRESDAIKIGEQTRHREEGEEARRELEEALSEEK